jgi:hypothetical protein
MPRIHWACVGREPGIADAMAPHRVSDLTHLNRGNRDTLTKYGPKSSLSPSIGDSCALCTASFAAGDYTTLVRKDQNGRFANDAVEVHWDCLDRRWPKATGV